MNAPIREELVEASAIDKDKYDIRDAIRWFKRVYKTAQELNILAEAESEYTNSQFGKVIALTVVDEKLPLGPLGEFVASVAMQEIAQHMVAEALAE